MGKPGWTAVSIREERLKALEKIYQKDPKRPHTQKFGAWFDNFVYELTAYEEELEAYGPFMSVENISGNTIIIEDNIVQDYVFVKVNSKEKRLQCERDESSSCAHIGFCFAVPSIYRILVKNGFKVKKQWSS